jgi:hypothetical protein
MQFRTERCAQYLDRRNVNTAGPSSNPLRKPNASSHRPNFALSRASSMAHGAGEGPASRAALRERRMEAMKPAMQPFSAVDQA